MNHFVASQRVYKKEKEKSLKRKKKDSGSV
jgi:hypothetical protein